MWAKRRAYQPQYPRWPGVPYAHRFRPALADAQPSCAEADEQAFVPRTTFPIVDRTPADATIWLLPRLRTARTIGTHTTWGGILLVSTICAFCDTGATTRCSHCGTTICGQHKVVGQPFITAGQLLTTIVSTVVHAPSLLGDILFKELDLVDYCAKCKAEIGARRQTEQLKFAGGLFLAMLAIVALPLLLYMS